MENNNNTTKNVDELLKDIMNVPEYDPVKYPKLNDTQMQEAGLFLYQMSLIGSSTDKNLQNLLWHVYLHMSNVIKETGRKTEEERHDVLIKSLKNLREYVKTSGNPIFKSLSDNLKEI